MYNISIVKLIATDVSLKKVNPWGTFISSVIFLITGCAKAGIRAIINPKSNAPTITKGTPFMPPAINIAASIHAIYNVWCPVKNMYFNLVYLAISMFTIIPRAIIKAVCVP